MRRVLRVVFPAGVVLACLTGPTAASAAPVLPGAPPIVVAPTNPNGTTGPPSVGMGVTQTGHPGAVGAHAAASSQAGSGQGGVSACTWELAPDVEQFLRHVPAALSNGAAPGGIGQTGGSSQDTVDPAARLYAQVCNGVVQGYQWFGPGQAGAPVVVLPTPAELAQQAYAQLRLPVPTVGHSPDLRLGDGRAAVLVGEHTWIWTERARFGPRSRRLAVGPVWARVTATPVTLTFDPGNGGGAVACSGPGTPYVVGRYGEHAASPTCDYVYRRSSASASGGVVTAAYAIGWRVSWTGSTGTAAAGGDLPDMTSRAAATWAVVEAQALGTTG